MQTPHLFAVLDTVVSTVVLIATATTTLLLTVPPAAAEELQLLLLPLLGALLPTAAMILLNPKPETRSIVIGRAAFSFFVATISPQIIAIKFTSMADFLSHPVVQVGAGGLIAAVCYALSQPFCAGLYRRSEALSNIAIQRAEGALLGTMRTAVNSVVDDKIKEATTQAALAAQVATVPVAAEMIKTAQAAVETQKLTA